MYSEEYLKCRVIIANMYETGRRNQEFKEKMVELGLWGEDDIVPPEPNDSAEVRRVAERLQNKGVMRVTAGDYIMRKGGRQKKLKVIENPDTPASDSDADTIVNTKREDLETAERAVKLKATVETSVNRAGETIVSFDARSMTSTIPPRNMSRLAEKVESAGAEGKMVKRKIQFMDQRHSIPE